MPPSQDTAPSSRPRTSTARLSLPLIVETALAVLDADGLGAVTTRRVAEELGTGQASLYAHVSTKDELLGHVLEMVMAELPLPTARGTWQQRLMRYGRQTRKALLEHPGLSAVALAAPPAGPGLLRRLEWVMTLLRSAGLPDRVVVAAVDSLTLFVVASAHEAELRGQEADHSHWAHRVGVDADLPGKTYPSAVALASMAASGSAQERFDVGLRLMVQGLEAHLLDAD